MGGRRDVWGVLTVVLIGAVLTVQLLTDTARDLLNELMEPDRYDIFEETP